MDSQPDFSDAEQDASPIVIDLDGDGVKTLALAGKRHFDLDNNGFAEQTAWVDGGDGLLVRDRDGNGRIESGAELFGDHTALADGTRAADGYAALAEHDDNGDGLIDAKDPIWRELQIWRDDNGDAHSAAEELHPLADFDITAIALAPTEVDETDAAGNRISHRGTVRLSDESSRDAADVWFRVNPALSVYRGDGEVAPEIAALPDVRAFGNVPSLHIAMQRDAGLERQVEAYLSADEDTRASLLDPLIYRWTGSDAVAPDSRGGNIDARKLVALEHLTGKNYHQGSWGPQPGPNAGKILEREYGKFAAYTQATLLLQTDTYAEILPYLYLAVAGEHGASGSESKEGWRPFGEHLRALHRDGQSDRARKEHALMIGMLGYSKRYRQALDLFWAENALDYLEILNAGIISTSLNGNDEANTLNGGSASEILLGHGGNDTLNGGDDRDTLIGGAGNDSLDGQDGDDRVNGDAGDDSVSGGNGDDYLDGGAGDDTLYGGNGADTLIGGVGDDELQGGHYSADTYVFAKGHGKDTVSDSAYRDEDSDTLRFEGASSDEALFSRSGNDLVIAAYGGDDQVTVNRYFSSSNSRYLTLAFNDKTLTVDDIAAIAFSFGGTAANDTLYGWASADTITGGDGNDRISGGGGADKLSGGAGNDRLDGQDGDDRVNGDAGDDTLTGGAGDDHLDGGAGNDHLEGGDDSDTLIGGTGDDELQGGHYSGDTYVFAKGHGKDTVSDRAYNDSQSDTLRFEGVNSDEAVFSRLGNDLVIAAYGGDDQVRVENYFSSGSSRYLTLAFNDKTLTVDDIAAIAFSFGGTAANDTLYGWASADTITGGDGNDRIYGGGGADTLIGGAGDDRLDGQDGDDRVSGDAGNDTLTGGAGDDHLDGGAGNDHLEGGGDSDTLIGGTGDDTLQGGHYSGDTYVFAKGHGKDTVSDRAYNDSQSDTLRFEGASSDEALFSRSGGDLVIAAYGGEDQVRVENYFYGRYHRYLKVAFSDKTLTVDDIAAIAFSFGGTAANDTLNGWASADTITGGDGNDRIYGGGGDDTLIGGAGNDRLDGQDGDDRANGNAGDDTLTGGAGDDHLDGGAGDDTLYGGNGADTLIGGTGDDELQGGSYSGDTYVFAKGHGKDTVSDSAYRDEDSDTLRFEGASSDEAVFSRLGNDLVIAAYGGEDQVRVENYFSDWRHRYLTLAFSDTTLTVDDIAAIGFSFGGTAANDTLSGWVSDDTIAGGDGNDWIYGGGGKDNLIGGAGHDRLDGQDGDDHLDGGAGNDHLEGGDDSDTLIGGTGDDELQGGHYSADTYVFAKGHGKDTVFDRAYNDSQSDTLRFEDSTAADLWFSRSGNNLAIETLGSEDRVVVSNWFSSTSYRHFNLQDSDGKMIDDREVAQLVSAMAAFGAGETAAAGSIAEQKRAFLTQIGAGDIWQSEPS